MAALLQTCSVQADKNYMDQLSSQLSRATGEVRFLTLKLHESEVREVKKFEYAIKRPIRNFFALYVIWKLIRSFVPN